MGCQHDDPPWTAQGRSEGSPGISNSCETALASVSSMSCHLADNFHPILVLCHNSRQFKFAPRILQIFLLFSLCPDLHFLFLQPWICYLQSWSYSAGSPWKLCCITEPLVLWAQDSLHQRRPFKASCFPDPVWSQIRLEHSCAGLVCLRCPIFARQAPFHWRSLQNSEFSCQPWEVLKQKATVSLLQH